MDALTKNFRTTVFFLFIIFSVQSFSNTPLDSLKQQLSAAAPPQKSNILKQFFQRNDSLSLSLGFIDLAISESVTEAERIFYKIQKSYFLSRNFYFTKSQLLLDSCLQTAINSRIDSLKGLVYFAKGSVFAADNNYTKAFEFLFKALHQYEQLKDTLHVLFCYDAIGTKYIEQNDTLHFKKAIELYQTGLRISRKNKKTEIEFINFLNKIGVAYDGIGENKKALEQYFFFYDIALKNNSTENIILSLLNIGDSYRILGDYEQAIAFTEKCIELSQKHNYYNYYYTAIANVAEIYYDLKNYKKSLELLLKIKNKVVASQENALKQFYLKLLAKAYDKSGNFKEATAAYQYYIAYMDSVFSIESKMKISEIEAKYETEKKEQQILLLEKNNELNISQIKRQTLMRNSFIVGFILMVLFAALIFVAYRIKRRDNNLLQLKNIEILQQKEEIQTQAENLEVANKEITKQKEHIEHIHSEQTHSILYAQKIQQAILPSENAMLRMLQEAFNCSNTKDLFFVLYKPKDIVSGDFFWMARRDKWLLFAVADCTGHGVPGAFMSMLGISFLNEIVSRKEIQSASLVLDELREHIIRSLQQALPENKSAAVSLKDGMDIAFCAIQTETLEMQFAGANNPIYVTSSHASTMLSASGTMLQSNGTILTEIRPDKMPVGVYLKMEPFTCRVTKMEKGDTLYLLSDGFQDQFGGPSGKKFYSKNLKQMLLENSVLPMHQQKELLESALEQWKSAHKNKYEQVDDITILGIKIS